MSTYVVNFQKFTSLWSILTKRWSGTILEPILQISQGENPDISNQWNYIFVTVIEAECGIPRPTSVALKL